MSRRKVRHSTVPSAKPANVRPVSTPLSRRRIERGSDPRARGCRLDLCAPLGAAVRRGSHSAPSAMKALYVFALTGEAMPPFAVDEHRVEFIDLDGLHAEIARRTEPPILSESSLRAQPDIVMRL